MKIQFEKFRTKSLRWKVRAESASQLICLLTISLLCSCQTTPTKFETLQKGRWSAKTLVKNLRESKSQIINLDVMAVRPDRMRIEVTTTLGIQLASLAFNHKTFSAALPQQKRFITGPANEKSFNYATGFPLEPSLFMNLLFDEEPKSKGWKCSRDQNLFLSACENMNLKIKVSWSEREVSRRRIQIDLKNYVVQMALQGFSTKVEEKEELFSINPPDGYKIERLK